MTKEETAKPRDCLACRLVGSAGLIGIGAYLANYAWKNKSFAGRVTLSTLSLGKLICCLFSVSKAPEFNVVLSNSIAVRKNTELVGIAVLDCRV